MEMGAQTSNWLRENPSALSFRGAEGDEESRKAFIFRARFLRLNLFGAGMTRFRKVFPQSAKERKVCATPASSSTDLNYACIY